MKIANFKKEAVSALRQAWRMGTLLPETVKKLQEAKMLPSAAQVAKGLDVGTQNILKTLPAGVVSTIAPPPKLGHVFKLPRKISRGMAASAVALRKLLTSAQRKEIPKGVDFILMTQPVKDLKEQFKMLANFMSKRPTGLAPMSQFRAILNRHEIDEIRELLRGASIYPSKRLFPFHAGPKVLLREAENVGRLSPSMQKVFKRIRSIPGSGLAPARQGRQIQAELKRMDYTNLAHLGQITDALGKAMENLRRAGRYPTELEQLAKAVSPHKIPGIYRVGS